MFLHLQRRQPHSTNSHSPLLSAITLNSLSIIKSGRCNDEKEALVEANQSVRRLFPALIHVKDGQKKQGIYDYGRIFDDRFAIVIQTHTRSTGAAGAISLLYLFRKVGAMNRLRANKCLMENEGQKGLDNSVNISHNSPLCNNNLIQLVKHMARQTAREDYMHALKHSSKSK